MRTALAGLLLCLLPCWAGAGEGALGRVQRYLVYYGPWDAAKVEKAWAFDLVILHPGRNLDLPPGTVARLRAGRDGKPGTADDVRVLGYLSIGEDEAVARGPRAAGDKMDGPVFRGPDGRLRPEGKGFRSWYVDEVALVTEDGATRWGADGLPETRPGQDGLPDENGKWRSYFVNAGDPEWAALLRQRGALILADLGCDGLFLDTVDTASPWGNYAWMQDDMAALVAGFRAWFPSALLVMNRGLFLFEKHGKTLAQAVDGVMFESFAGEWDWHRALAAPHRWFAGNIDALDFLRPHLDEGRRPAVLFLDYVNPRQEDAALFLATLLRHTRGLPGAHAISSPDLQTVHPSFVLPADPLPPERELAAAASDGDQFSLDLSAWGLSEPPGPDRIFLSLARAGGLPARPFTPLAAGDLDGTRLALPGVDPGEWVAELWLVDERGVPLARGRAAFTVPDTGRPGIVPLVDARAGEASLRLSWAAAPRAARYALRWGLREDLADAAVLVTERPQAVLSGLRDGNTCFVQVRAVGGGRVGFPSPVCAATPVDCTPPGPPALAEVSVAGLEVSVRFTPSRSPDTAGHHVYLDPAELGGGLPLKVGPGRAELLVRVPAPGAYDLRVSAFDANNNESAATPARRVVVRAP